MKPAPAGFVFFRLFQIFHLCKKKKMKDFLDYTFWVLILLLGIFAGYHLRAFSGGRMEETVRIDTVFIHVHDTLPSLPVQVKIIEKQVPADVDTVAILNDYFAQKIYDDREIIRDNLKILIRDTISQNTILGRSIIYDFTYPEITKTVLQKPLYTLSAFIDTRMSPSLAIGYKRVYIQGGYDFRNRATFVGVGLKLFEK
jgi:hypothetical protein